VLRTPSAEDRACLLALAPGAVSIHRRAEPVGPLAVYASSLGRDDSLVATLELPGVRGVLAVAGRVAEVSTFGDEDARLLGTLARHAALALAKGKLIEGLQREASRHEHEARHDPLTGLANRAALLERCRAALAVGATAGPALIVVDLDGFREVNDAFGPEVGDAALVEVARRLEPLVEVGEVVARVGGDEFALLLPSADRARGAGAVAARAVEALRAPVVVGGTQLGLHASVGIAFGPAESAIALLLDAAGAVADAKGGTASVVVRPERRGPGAPPRRLQMAADLRRAVDAADLVVHFQPTADLRTGAIVGAEALLRWPHALRGDVPPATFVPLAVQTGLAHPLTLLVLREAIGACVRWRARGHELGVSVNVAARSLVEHSFAADVEAMLWSAGLPSGALVLELGEAALMGEARRGLAALERLAGLGVQISVDDVGTGRTSLPVLQQLPVHELKVDRTFVSRVCDDDGARSTVRAATELGHGLGLRVVAEGVEHQRAWDEVLELGCDLAQGYVLSPALPEREVVAWLDQRRARATGAAANLAGGAVPAGLHGGVG
jgi:diguanylate cyclase (GGDEF)-like protein